MALSRTWETDKYDSGKLVLENDELKSLWRVSEEPTPQGNIVTTADMDVATVDIAIPPGDSAPVLLTDSEFIDEVFGLLPAIDMFEDNSLLPPKIDLDDLIKKNTKTVGYEGAKNFLLIADINPEELQNPSSLRMTEDRLDEKK